MDHLNRTTSELSQRLQHLQNQMQLLQLPDEVELAAKKIAWEQGQADATGFEQALSQLRIQEKEQVEQIKQLRESQLSQQRNLAQLKQNHIAIKSRI